MNSHYRQVGIYQVRNRAHPPVFDVQVDAQVMDDYDCLGTLPLELEQVASAKPGHTAVYSVAQRGDTWHTGNRYQDENNHADAQGAADEIAGREWWKRPDDRLKQPPPALNAQPDGPAVAHALTALARLTHAVGELSTPDIIGIDVGNQRPGPVLPRHFSGSFDDDAAIEIGQLLNEYMRTHHAEFVRWANLQVEKQAALSRQMVKALHENPHAFSPRNQG